MSDDDADGRRPDDAPTDGGDADSAAIDRAFADGPAFVPYLAVGDPDVEASVEYVEALERGGADVIELGLPFSEPIAEGPTIQGAVARSLDAGMTPERFFEAVERLDADVPLVCMTYYNLIYQYGRAGAGDGDDASTDVEGNDDSEGGPKAFVQRAADAGISGLVVPDLPAEESGPLREACDAHGLDLVFIVAPTTRDERLERIMDRTSGYVYVQARLGVTGAQADVSARTGETLDRLAGYDVPKAVGFGISTGEQAREVVAAGADGVIVGSALVDIVAGDDPEGVATDPDDTGAIADRLEAKARELVEGACAGADETAKAAEATGTGARDGGEESEETREDAEATPAASDEPAEGSQRT